MDGLIKSLELRHEACRSVWLASATLELHISDLVHVQLLQPKKGSFHSSDRIKPPQHYKFEQSRKGDAFPDALYRYTIKCCWPSSKNGEPVNFDTSFDVSEIVLAAYVKALLRLTFFVCWLHNSTTSPHHGICIRFGTLHALCLTNSIKTRSLRVFELQSCSTEWIHFYSWWQSLHMPCNAFHLDRCACEYSPCVDISARRLNRKFACLYGIGRALQPPFIIHLILSSNHQHFPGIPDHHLLQFSATIFVLKAQCPLEQQTIAWPQTLWSNIIHKDSETHQREVAL